MSNKKNILGVLFGLFIVLVAVAGSFAMSDIYASGVWRYRVTVEIETPTGIKTGYAIREVSNSASDIKIIDLPNGINPAKFKGEAVVIDSEDQKKIFALISDTPYSEFYSAFPTDGSSTLKGIKYYNTLKSGTMNHLPERYYPLLVTFKDVNDPKTVKQVGDHSKSGALDNDIKIKSITFEITDEPVTSKIDKLLPWLNGLNGKYLNGKSTSRDAPLGLHTGYFKREDN